MTPSTLPLQLLFWIDAASLKSGRYRETIESYYNALLLRGQFSGCPDNTWASLPRPIAYVRLTDAEKPLLPDLVDFLYDYDVKPIVQDGTQVKERGVTDMFFILDRAEIQQVPFVLHIGGDYTIQPATGNALLPILHQAVATLAGSHMITSIGFSSSFVLFPAQPVSNIYDVAHVLKWPAVLRTRDLYLASLVTLQQPREHGDQPLVNALSAFSYSPARHLQFNQNVAVSI